MNQFSNIDRFNNYANASACRLANRAYKPSFRMSSIWFPICINTEPELESQGWWQTNVPGGVADQCHPPHHPPRPRVLRDRVRLYLDHLPTGDLRPGPGPDPGLVLLDLWLGHHHHVVALGEDPPVEVWRDVAADVHLGEVLVVGHLLRWEADPSRCRRRWIR